MVSVAPGVAGVTPWEGEPAVYFSHDASLTETGEWYYNFEYGIERERGLDWKEDLYNPFVLTYSLDNAPSAVLICATQPGDATDASAMRRKEIARRKALLRQAPKPNSLVQR
jgi:hypothetical protein